MAANSNPSFKNRPSNYVIFTLMAITAGEMKVSQAGHPFTFSLYRAFASHPSEHNTELDTTTTSYLCKLRSIGWSRSEP